MNGSLAANRTLLAALLAAARERAASGVDARVDVIVCPTFLHLAQVAELLQGAPVALGAQNVSEHASGAYTGEVSAGMLVESGCRYVIVGHSERRTLYGENDTQVAAKFVAAQKAGLVPILCVGERLEEREADATATVVLRQLDAVVAAAGAAALGHAVVAYEPVWAIGTGRTASPAQAQEVHAILRSRVASHDANVARDLSILYGGSVKAGNAAELFAMPDIDGGLIGGAALVADEFNAIIAAAAKESK